MTVIKIIKLVSKFRGRYIVEELPEAAFLNQFNPNSITWSRLLYILTKVL
ncbi:MAG: hypothetical protein ACYDG2_13875 [Ruminiclostridium sp.]